jgi:DnaK suppressor protein
MELERARSRSSTERGQVQQLLADLGKARTDDHEVERDVTYPAQPLAQQGVDDAVAAGLRDRLAALDRAQDGSYGRSIRLACCCANFPLRQSSSGLSQESQSTGHGESCFIGDYFGLAISGMKV